MPETSTPAVLLSTSSVYPEQTPAAFEVAAGLGYDGVEVMVWTDAASQDASVLQGLAAHYGQPVKAIHAPCLLVTQRVWTKDPWEKLRRSAVLAEEVGASTVVVHPPFVWQRDYAKAFAEGLARLSDKHPGVRFAVENMYPVRMGRRELVPYAPGWDPTSEEYSAYTLDISHCAASRTDALAMMHRMGDALAHLHLGDGNGQGRDEHRVPGRGSQPCDEVLSALVARGFTGSVSMEVSTRKAKSRRDREADLAEALAYARRYLNAPAVTP